MDRLKNRLVKAQEKAEALINEFSNNEFHIDDISVVKFSDLLGVSDNNIMSFHTGIVGWKTPTTDPNIINFITILYPHTKFGKHVHPDCDEKITIIQGELYDDINNVIYTIGESVVYPVDIPHLVSNASNQMTIINVTFTKTN